MAGIFGFFDYNKPGPGVDKNAPKKRRFIEFWELFLRKFWRLIQINLIYVLSCVPVVTIGLANAGLTYVTRNFTREKAVFTTSDYFDTIRKNWKQALPIGILNLAFLVLLVVDVDFFFHSYVETREFLNLIFLAVVCCLYVIFTIMKYYLYMMMITFRFSFKQLYKNAMLMVSAGLKSNLIISGLLLLAYGLMLLPLFISIEAAIVIDGSLLLFLFPAFRSMLIQYYIFPVVKQYILDPYYKEHPEERKTAARILNIEYGEGEEPSAEKKSESVFQDRGSARTDLPSDSSASVIPKQYSERELRGRGRERLPSKNDEDDVI